MPGPLLHLGATVTCAHAGQASPVAPNPRVFVSGQPVVPMASTHLVTGCTLPSNAGGPCVSAQWVTAAARVFAAGAPVLLIDSQAICTPTGTPLLPVTVQVRVIGM